MKAASASILTLTDSTCHRSRGEAWRITDNGGPRRHTWLASGPGEGCSYFTHSGLKPLCSWQHRALSQQHPNCSFQSHWAMSLRSQIGTFLSLLSNCHGSKSSAAERAGQGPIPQVCRCLRAHPSLQVLSTAGFLMEPDLDWGHPCLFLLVSWER